MFLYGVTVSSIMVWYIQFVIPQLAIIWSEVNLLLLHIFFILYEWYNDRTSIKTVNEIEFYCWKIKLTLICFDSKYFQDGSLLHNSTIHTHVLPLLTVIPLIYITKSQQSLTSPQLLVMGWINCWSISISVHLYNFFFKYTSFYQRLLSY